MGTIGHVPVGPEFTGTGDEEGFVPYDGLPTSAQIRHRAVGVNKHHALSAL